MSLFCHCVSPAHPVTYRSDSRPKKPRSPVSEALSPRAASALREAIALTASGNLKAAESTLLVAHFHAPEHPDILRCAGTVQYRQGRLRDAADSWSRALAVRPEDADVFILLSAVQWDLFEFNAADDSLRRAESVAASADTWLKLGIEQGRQGASEDALRSADRVLALRPKDGIAHLLRSQSRQALGDVDGAAEDYRALIERNEHVARAWFGLLDLKVVAIGPDELAALERATAKPGHSTVDGSLLKFALGRAYEAAGRFEDAFATLERANADARRDRFWDAAAFTREVAAVRAAFAGPVTRAPSAQGSEIIFLVGLPRSATTLFEQVLSAHPRVEGASELPYLNMVVQEESQRRGMRFPAWVVSATPEDWDRMGKRYLQMSARWRQSRPKSTDKLPENWLLAGAAMAMLPNAKVIDCRRDPTETCWSCYKQLFAPGRAGFAYDFATLSCYWREYDALCRFWAERHPNHVRVQDYETFLARPEAEIRALLEFCDLEFDPSCLRWHEAQRSVRTASAAQVRQPLRHDTARTGGYGNRLAPLREMLATAAETKGPAVS